MDIIFGPVQSRRFGESLGIDLSPKTKQCNYDCLYCELKGKKAQDSMQEILEVEEILEAIKKGLKQFKNIQSLTITANGEPTLYPYLYELMLRLEDIKGGVQTLLLTNGSLLWDLSVSRACLLFDKVKFSLDAISPEVFKKIDRPTKNISLEQILQGIYQFSADFSGELYAEILFVKNINDNLDEIKKMARFLAPMRLKRLDISSIDRPPAYKVSPISQEQLEIFARIFRDFKIPTFLPTRTPNTKKENLNLSQDEILKTLALRPMSKEDIESLWNKESINRLEILHQEKKVSINNVNGINFFITKGNL
ncbi:molybdenum cofactor biosynthesis protein MoaA [Helicobacter pullorum]|uniref:radical SAM protein n=1 Tax=Helicobacter pullorum TaxID=35818 RepID=UPI00081695E3|nr:radical SAM protein [Helicobacter pullorum]OCR03599.1 molybdenum cofactor biosynthesis protein MoaA [Helicobacter pullorum]OCR07424.1 molybdenum cofactor biosynthesis protein MoaA [Helicobacter pullorum]OCR11315.1 molybdenum cofactor biosynthesis protein MoaA [Helicobacter pullorum]OCR13214.1 molybdenum cofactor biosynthesis protein MoaA [Helicobacter pullorum]